MSNLIISVPLNCKIISKSLAQTFNLEGSHPSQVDFNQRLLLLRIL